MTDERAVFTMLMNHFLLVYPQAILMNLPHIALPIFARMHVGLIVYFYFFYS